MPKVIGVRFRDGGKVYNFDPAGFCLKTEDLVVVETSKGVQVGIISESVLDLPEEKLVAPLKPVMRIANKDDIRIYEENKEFEKEAFPVCAEKIAARGLDMDLVDVEYLFDRTKLIFYFVSEGRVDFRELVRDLASVFKLRIELRQIGVRDEAKMIGGLGVCGRELCCASFLTNFMPVSIKMAKEQNVSMNPSKISGACGRLLCCLKYEQDAYRDARKRIPKNGAHVITPEGRGVVASSNLLRETVTVRLERNEDTELVTFELEELTGYCPKKKG